MATSLAMMSALSSVPGFIEDVKIGAVDADWAQRSPLASLLVPSETVALATRGNDGSALFTSTRLLVGHETGLMSKRLLVKAVRRSAIDAWSVDRDKLVTLVLRGAGFGYASLIFGDEDFDPMQLMPWLGQTLAPAQP